MKLRKTRLVSLMAVAALLQGWSNAAIADSALSYEGTVGTAGIGMTLYVSNGLADLLNCSHVSGKYFYNQFMKDIKIEGDTDGKRGIVLYEYDPNGKRVAVIKGTLPDKDPGGIGTEQLKGEVMTGTWSSIDGGKTLPVSLRMSASTVASADGNPYSVAGVDDAETFEQKVKRFKNAVLNNDRKTVASMMHYPVLASVKTRPRKIHNADELLSNYDTIFTPKYLELIKRAIPHNMFARYDGVMLGDSGEVWFDADGKVKTLND
jgi:hypothetical protein